MNHTDIHNETMYSAVTDAIMRDTQPGITDYSWILKTHGLPFREIDAYLQVGEPQPAQGWILDISVIAMQIPALLNAVLPVLIKEAVPFKTAKEIEAAKAILNGQLGYTQLGKVMSIYPATDAQAFSLALELISLTSPFKGPRILTDRHLGAAVYTRYGAFNPVLLTTESGSQEAFIYDRNGQLVKEPCSIPFTLPTAVNWPFGALVAPEAKKPDTVLKDKYKMVTVLKQDARGNVIKGLFHRGFFRVTWCLIKEGKQNMSADDHGRDIKDRLRWQQELHNTLEAFVPLPKIYDFFEQDGNNYLVMEFIKGRPLDACILEAFDGKPWYELSLQNRLQLLDYLEQILDMISVMHAKGYVHRDINPVNFLVNKKNKLVMIDLELAYSTASQKPLPPFRWGTAWFMSPEQEAAQIPTVKEDIYSLGATMLALFTGLLPNKFEIIDANVLYRQLYFLLPDESLIKTISACLQVDSSLRPSIDEIKSAVDLLKKKQTATQRQGNILRPVKIFHEELEDTISRAVKMLSTPLMMAPNQLWFSKVIQDDAVAYYQSEDLTIYGGLHAGVGGVMLLLARLKKCGFTIDNCLPGYQESLHLLKSQYIKQAAVVPSGLYAGTAGTALTLAEGISSALIPNTQQNIQEIKTCFEHGNFNGLSIATGIAGAGLSLLRCADLLDANFAAQLLQQYAANVLEQQQPDGSWFTAPETPGRKITGFSHGVAGIASFLMAYADQYKSEEANNAGIKAMHWLTKQAHRNDQQLIWYTDTQKKVIDPGVHNGFAGIAFSYINAYKITEDPHYKRMAEKALQNYPFHITSRNFTLASGLAGIGEVYLEAARIFGAADWQERANWIALLLIHCYKHHLNSSIFWLVDDSPFSTADLLVGNSGVLHFLLHHRHPDKTSHPLFPQY